MILNSGKFLTMSFDYLNFIYSVYFFRKINVLIAKYSVTDSNIDVKNIIDMDKKTYIFVQKSQVLMPIYMC